MGSLLIISCRPSLDLNRNSAIISLSVRLLMILPRISFAREIEDRTLELLNNLTGIYPPPFSGSAHNYQNILKMLKFSVSGTVRRKVYLVNVGKKIPNQITCIFDIFNFFTNMWTQCGFGRKKKIYLLHLGSILIICLNP